MQSSAKEKLNARIYESTFNLLDLIAVLKANLWKILLTGAVSAGIVFAVNKFFISPYFVATTTIVSNSKDSLPIGGAVTQALVQAAGGASNSELLQYEKILKTRALAKKVAEKMQMPPTESFPNLSLRLDGPALELSYKSSDPIMASNILQNFLDALTEAIQTKSASRAYSAEIFVKERLKEAEDALREFEKKILQLKFSQANREYQIQTKVVSLLREQYELAQIETKKQQQAFWVIDPPTPPTKRAGPQTASNTLIAGFLGLCLSALGFVLFAAFRQETQKLR